VPRRTNISCLALAAGVAALGIGQAVLQYKAEAQGIATDSKGNLYTTETYEGKRLQKFVYKGVGSVPRGYQGVLWPRR